MSGDKFLDIAREAVVNYFNSIDKTDNKQITKEDTYIVWSVKVLQNNKALVSTTVSDGMYYEVRFTWMPTKSGGIRLLSCK